MGLQSYDEYEDRIVVFIDILGFSSMVKITDNDNSKSADKKKEAITTLVNLTEALNFIKEEVKILKSLNLPTIRLTQFSDSLVISSKEKSNEILFIFNFLKLLQVQLLSKYEILIRGGVVKGKVIHDEQILLGPAMVDAYNLESKCANSPRIVVTPSVYEIYRTERIKNNIETKKSVLKKDFDGMFYVDYFNLIGTGLKMSEVVYKEIIDKIISNNLTSRDITIRVKYYWMRSKLEDREKTTEFKMLHNSKVS